MRRPGALVGVLIVLGLAAFFVLRGGHGGEKGPATPQSRYIPPEAEADETPAIPFTDVTQATGIGFEHVTGGFALDDGSPSRFLPECMGPGVVLFDPDGDGDRAALIADG